MQNITLKSGNQIPILGFGTWQSTGDSAKEAVKTALEVGFRHIDTAQMYENHEEVGAAIKESGIPREEIFLTTKLWQDSYKKEDVRPALERALRELDTDYLDLWLMHWPDRSIPFDETLTEMQSLQTEGLIKDFGVCNFTINHLKDESNTGIPLAMNQVEFHPTLYQKELLDFCNENDIPVTAYSPIGRGHDLKEPVITEIAEKHDRSANQVIINWLIQKNVIAIPKSENPDHIADNLKALEWNLDDEDIEKIDAIGGENRLVEPPFADFDY